ncbi:hypothetical protein [Prochlorococcus sp. MIT 1300]|nr:hypothetical protein [Prochlorococcus sp. MIT 1300]
MNYQDGFLQIQTFVPAAIGGTLCIFAVLGIRELLRETSVAFKNGAKA